MIRKRHLLLLLFLSSFFLSCEDKMDEHYEKGLFLCSGRKVPRTGGIILCNCHDMETAASIMKQDPFYREGIADYKTIEFIPSKSSDLVQKALSQGDSAKEC